MATLRILHGANENSLYELDPQHETLLGRDPGCDLIFPDRTVSRQHARIRLQNGAYWIEDLQSVNGVEVNGRKISDRVRLYDGDKICLHDVVLQLLDPANPPPPGARSDLTSPASDDDSTREEYPPGFDFGQDSSQDRSTIVTQVDARSSMIQHLRDNPVLKLQAILEITQSLGSSLNLSEVLPRILDSLFRIFPQTKRGYILQRERDSGALELRAIKHEPSGSDTVSHIGGHVALRVMREGVAFLSGDAVQDDRLHEMADSALDESEQLRSVMCAPLMGPSKTPLGVIHLETHDPLRTFSPGDLQVLVSVAFLAGQAVEYTEIHEELREMDRRTIELEMARDLQLAFLPQRAPRTSAFQFSHHYRAAQYVAGDYFEYVELPHGRIAVIVGDVAGKGVSAAMTMARICSDIRYALLTTDTPAEAVARLNWQLSVQFPDLPFITQILCVLNEYDHTLTVVNAGHPYPLLRRADTKQVRPLMGVGGVTVGGPALNVQDGAMYEQFTVPLEPGDLVLLYTDGISEAMNRRGDLYKACALSSAVSKAGPEPKHVIRAILNDVRLFCEGHPFHDDVCLVSFVRRPT